MADLTIICGTCRSTAPDGYLSVRYAEISAYQRAVTAWEEAHPGDGHYLEELMTMPEEIAWRGFHGACDPGPDEGAYQIGAETLRTWRDLTRWSAHLSGKNWIGFTDWDEVLREAAGQVASRRIIAIGVAAA